MSYDEIQTVSLPLLTSQYMILLTFRLTTTLKSQVNTLTFATNFTVTNFLVYP